MPIIEILIFNFLHSVLPTWRVLEIAWCYVYDVAINEHLRMLQPNITQSNQGPKKPCPSVRTGWAKKNLTHFKCFFNMCTNWLLPFNMFNVHTKVFYKYRFWTLFKTGFVKCNPPFLGHFSTLSRTSAITFRSMSSGVFWVSSSVRCISTVTLLGRWVYSLPLR
jgi:hypothetical protein